MSLRNNEGFNTLQRIGDINQELRTNTLNGITDKRMYNRIWLYRMELHRELKFYRDGGSYAMWKKQQEKNK